MNEDLTSLIESIGFKEKESQIYLALLELGKANVSQVSHFSKIKRPTAYLILEDLLEKGYVTQIPGKKIIEYQAVDPAIILIKKRTELRNFSEMVPYLQTLHNKGGEKPKIHYVDNKEGIWNIYESLNYEKEAFCISSYKKINEHFPGKVDHWIKGYKKKNYKVNARHLIPNDPKEFAFGEKFKEAGQNIRVLNKNFDTDIVITESKLSISSLEENPFLVLIESKRLARSLKPIFEIIWENSQKL